MTGYCVAGEHSECPNTLYDTGACSCPCHLADRIRITISEATAEDYVTGCEEGCARPEARTEALVVVTYSNTRQVTMCTAHASWAIGADIAAMGLRAGLSVRGATGRRNPA